MTAESEAADDGALYVLGITPAGATEPGDDMRLVTCGNLQAVCVALSMSEVALLKDDMDPHAVAPMARRHDLALKSIMASSPVLPCRFCTIVAGEEQVWETLSGRYERFVEGLDRVRGKAEWGVKIRADQRYVRRLVDEQNVKVRRVQAEFAASPVGKAYLLRRKSEQVIQEAIRQKTAELGERCDRTLSKIAAFRELLELRSEPTDEGVMILNGSYLVGSADRADFHAEVEALGRPSGFAAALTGPWPPYSFVER